MENLELIGSAEMCEALRIDRGTLVRRIAAGKITAVQKLPGVTGAYVFTRAEMDRCVAAEQTKAKAS